MEKAKGMPLQTKPKRIVYLFGAGATQAELDYVSADVNLLMRDNKSTGLEGVCTRVIKSTKQVKSLKWLYELKTESNYIDIEQLISLLDTLNLVKYRKHAELLRTLYYKDILSNLRSSRILKKPQLALSLFRMHQMAELKQCEKLTGIISLNHDYVVETACQQIYGGINLGFKFTQEIFRFKKDAPLIIKVFGSFNWQSGSPIRIKKVEPSKPPHARLLWIPPTITKESTTYPFNKLMGRAYESLSLECDILRIIGCSLSQNDWKVVALLFETQCILRNKCFDIQLIRRNSTGEETKDRLGFLKNVYTIAELGGSFSNFQDQDPRNPFEEWLIKKLEDFMRDEDINEDNVDKNLLKFLRKE